MTYEEAIKAIKDNYPSSGYTMLCKGLDIAIECIEKQIPKKPLHFIQTFENGCDDWEYDCCPICGNGVTEDYDNYCSNCGQALDWSDE